jgi:hypothetical protein
MTPSLALRLGPEHAQRPSQTTIFPPLVNFHLLAFCFLPLLGKRPEFCNQTKIDHRTAHSLLWLLLFARPTEQNTLLQTIVQFAVGSGSVSFHLVP